MKRFQDETIEQARRDGYVETLTGRRRTLRDINSKNGMIRSAAERTAINTPIQGTAADMIKIAMVRVARLLDEGGYRTRMLLQVHDELVFDLHRGEKDELVPKIEEAMKTALPLACPSSSSPGRGRTGSRRIEPSPAPSGSNRHGRDPNEHSSLRRTDRPNRDAPECAELMASSEPWLTLRGIARGGPCRPHRSRARGARRPRFEGIAGFVIIDLRGLLRGYVQILCVRADCRGRGLGSALLQWAEERIFHESPNVFLCVSSFNGGARRLYERRGYEVVGTLCGFVVAGHDELLLRKTRGSWEAFREGSVPPPQSPADPGSRGDGQDG